MCTVCGCATDQQPTSRHPKGDGERHLHFGTGDAGVSVPGLSQTRVLQIEKDVFSKNNAYAARNRDLLCERNVLAMNLVSSPGAGKTTLLVETLKRLQGETPAFVIEGDQQTENDAERIRATGAPAVQINTGKGCHLDAHMVGHALEKFSLARTSFLFIENVGNLVCPAGFDLGETVRIVILSVTEGDDKPLKYPDIFASADLMILTKTDLLPHVDFCVGDAVANARAVNDRLQVLQVSTRTGDGLTGWLDWLKTARSTLSAGRSSGLAAE